MGELPKSRLELVTELIKATAWPSLALVALWGFWGPLQEAAKQLPALIGRSEVLTIAGVSLRVGSSLREKATPEMQKVLAEISPDGLRWILSTSEGGAYWDAGDVSTGRRETMELRKLGLVEEVPAQELNDPRRGRRYGYGVRSTHLGKRTHAFLVSLVAEFVQGLEHAAREGAAK